MSGPQGGVIGSTVQKPGNPVSHRDTNGKDKMVRRYQNGSEAANTS